MTGRLALLLVALLAGVVAAQDGDGAFQRRLAAGPPPVVPNVPADMAPTQGTATAFVTLEPLGEARPDDGPIVPTLIASGRSWDDWPGAQTVIDSDVYASWAAYPLGTQAWLAYESLAGDLPQLDQRRVHQLGAIDERMAWQDEWYIDGPIVQADSRSFAGMAARQERSWVVLPRRGREVLFWRAYRMKVTVTPCDLADDLKTFGTPAYDAAQAELVRRREAGWALPERLDCLVVDWFEPLPPDSEDAAAGFVRYTRDVRHIDVPGFNLYSEVGLASEAADGELVLVPDMRWRVERVLHLNDTGGTPLATAP